LERSVTWAGLRAGDPVMVTGTRLRSASWSFSAFVRNTKTGEVWVEVVGGRPGDRNTRSFRPEQVFPPGRRRAGNPTSPSFAEAPQLPLG
jgi:hypothetical protein